MIAFFITWYFSSLAALASLSDYFFAISFAFNAVNPAALVQTYFVANPLQKVISVAAGAATEVASQFASVLSIMFIGCVEQSTA